MFLLLTLSPVLERSDREVDTRNSLGDDLGAESLTRDKQIGQHTIPIIGLNLLE